MKSEVTFIQQDAPVGERGRAMYAIARSIIRAHIDSLSAEDLLDLNTPLDKVTLRQLAKLARIERDKGIRGDGFEWAVHEAIIGGEPTVSAAIAEATKRASKFAKDSLPTSILFGQERAKYLGFLDAVVTEAGQSSFILPQVTDGHSDSGSGLALRQKATLPKSSFKIESRRSGKPTFSFPRRMMCGILQQRSNQITRCSREAPVLGSESCRRRRIASGPNKLSGILRRICGW